MLLLPVLDVVERVFYKYVPSLEEKAKKEEIFAESSCTASFWKDNI